MKKNLSIVMLVLLGIAWYVTLSTWFGNEEKYENIIAEAHRLEEKGLYLGAIEQYEEAKGVKGTALLLEEWIADDYLAMGNYKEYRKKLDAILDEYGPIEKDVEKLYEFTKENFSEESLMDLVSSLYEKYPDSEVVLRYYDEMKGRYVERACTYERIFEFAGEYAVYMQNGKQGLIDQYGKIILEAVYDEVLFDGKDTENISVRDGNKCFYINQMGYKTSEPEIPYTYVGIVSQRRIVAQRDGKYGYLDQNFKEKTEFIYDDATGLFEGTGAVKQGDKWALINRSGELVTEFIYDDVFQNSRGICSVNKMIAVRQGDDCFFVNEKGERVSEINYEKIKTFETEEMCAVCMDGKWGYIDQNENIKIACSYEDAKPFTYEYAAVKENGLWGYIDNNNKMVIKPVFHDVGFMTESGAAPVSHGNTWTLLQLKIKD